MTGMTPVSATVVLVLRVPQDGHRTPSPALITSSPCPLLCRPGNYLAFIAAGFISLPFLLLINIQLSLENPFSGEDDDDADPDDIRLDELQLMGYMKEDAMLQAEIQAEIQEIQRNKVPPLEPKPLCSTRIIAQGLHTACRVTPPPPLQAQQRQ